MVRNARSSRKTIKKLRDGSVICLEKTNMALLEKAYPGLPMVKGKRAGQKLHGEEQKIVS